MSGIVNKVKAALHSDHSSSTTHGTTTTGTTTSGTAEGVAGPHSSRVGNTVDPRIDSDLDNPRTVGASNTATHGTTGLPGTHGTSSTTTAGPHSSSGLTGTSHSTGTASSTTPHNNNLMNKLDPRVDSTTTGAYSGNHASNTTGTGPLTGNTAHSSGLTGNTHSSGLTGTSHNTTGTGYGTSSSTTTPHNNNMMNKIDPRVDSATTGAYSGTHAGHTSGISSGTGTHGGISSSTNAGPHQSNVGNKIDPLVDSDLDGRGNRHGASTGGILGASGSHATAGSGTAQNTAGPHNSDLANKLDPRVDSNRDDSKTFMGDKTHA